MTEESHMDLHESSTGAGQSVKEWAEDAGIGASTFYTIPQEQRPHSVNIGRRKIITEPAPEWLKRVAAQGGVKTIKSAA